MQRYYQSSPVLSGLGSLISGAVNTRHQVKAQEAAAQDRATMQVYGGMGEGLGNVASSYAGTMLNQHNRNVDFQNDVALLNQRGQQAQEFEALRSANDEHEYLNKAFLATQGIGGTPKAMMGGMDAGGMPGMDMGGMVMPGMPPTMPEAKVPLPAQDPKFIPAYREAEQTVTESVRAIEKAELDPHMPVSQKNAIYRAALPKIFAGQQVLQRYAQPKPPTSEEELMAAGPMNGGFTQLKDGTRVTGSKDGLKFHDPAKSPPSFTPPKDGIENANYQRTMIPNYDERVADGWMFITQRDGKIDHVAPKDSTQKSFIVADPNTGTSQEYIGDVAELPDGTLIHNKNVQVKERKSTNDDKAQQNAKKAADKRLADARKQAEANRKANEKARKDAEKIIEANQGNEPEQRDARLNAMRDSFGKLPTDPIQIMRDNLIVEHRAEIAQFSPKTITMDEYRALGEKILADHAGDLSAIPTQVKDELRALGVNLR
jgi:hypothetical protein